MNYRGNLDHQRHVVPDGRKHGGDHDPARRQCDANAGAKRTRQRVNCQENDYGEQDIGCND